MNKNIDKLFILIYNNKVLFVETNVLDFYKRVVNQAIGYSTSYGTMKNRFKDTLRFSHTDANGRVYWIEKILNEDNPKG
jgi:hypothetical protein